jgi:uncharacterized protein
MQFTREHANANLVSAWEHGAIRVGERWIHGHVILSGDHIIDNWAVTDPRELTFGDLAPATALEPHIILLGTGKTLIFPDPRVSVALAAERIGLEVMDTAAACRTFNVLVSEQRRVVAALFNHGP